MRGEKRAKGSNQGSYETVVVAREGLVGREHQTPVRLGLSVRSSVEGQVVFDVLCHDGAFKVLSRGEESRVAQLSKLVVFLDGDDVVALGSQGLGDRGGEHLVEE